MRAGCGGKIEWQAGCYRRLGARAQCAGGGQGVTATPFTGRPATLRGFSVVAPGCGRVCRLWTLTSSDMRIFYSTLHWFPPRLVDVVELFGIELARRGVVTEWYAQRGAPGP